MDYEEDLVFKWQNNLDETTMKSTNSSPEKEVENIFSCWIYLFTCIIYCHSQLHPKLKNCLVLFLRFAHLFTFISLYEIVIYLSKHHIYLFDSLHTVWEPILMLAALLLFVVWFAH